MHASTPPCPVELRELQRAGLHRRQLLRDASLPSERLLVPAFDAYDVVWNEGPLGLTLVNSASRAVVKASRHDRVSAGDVLVAVNGRRLLGVPFDHVLTAVRTVSKPAVLTFESGARELVESDELYQALAVLLPEAPTTDIATALSPVSSSTSSHASVAYCSCTTCTATARAEAATGDTASLGCFDEQMLAEMEALALEASFATADCHAHVEAHDAATMTDTSPVNSPARSKDAAPRRRRWWSSAPTAPIRSTPQPDPAQPQPGQPAPLSEATLAAAPPAPPLYLPVQYHVAGYTPEGQPLLVAHVLSAPSVAPGVPPTIPPQAAAPAAPALAVPSAPTLPVSTPAVAPPVMVAPVGTATEVAPPAPQPLGLGSFVDFVISGLVGMGKSAPSPAKKPLEHPRRGASARAGGYFKVRWHQDSLGLSLKNVDGRVQVVAVGTPPPELAGRFEVGDELVAVNGFETARIGYQQSIHFLQTLPKPVRLRFLRAGADRVTAL
ncbi:hypothetical protein ACHHYP_09595 [Achlya hypogyna]|uniref:PDZ domain-containing protein n=1 Tax=Achlya hypogyna TaxID=1202772 RepID=A0A1V9YMS5_ACHHY|nr:hypothetical protein ACHHYP_09595 [Achlya hypogyna]